MAKASRARKAPQQKTRKSTSTARQAPKRRELAKRETPDTILLMIRQRPLQALALALGMGLALGIAWPR